MTRRTSAIVGVLAVVIAATLIVSRVQRTKSATGVIETHGDASPCWYTRNLEIEELGRP
ncbi:MAG: hypothetical protein ACJ765_13320 [Chloroflexota bacterium]